MKILGIGADGDSKFRKYYFERFLKRHEPLHNVISIRHKGFNFVSVVEDIYGLTVPTVMFPDWKHFIKKWRKSNSESSMGPCARKRFNNDRGPNETV